MPIPQEILSVSRPKNSVVIAYGKNKSLYAVRERVGCKYVNGRRLPVNGPTIGHIIDGQYVPIDNNTISNVSASHVDLKDWANIILCDKLFSDMKDELSLQYSSNDLLKIYCIAILRVCHPGIKDYELQDAYESSFLSEIYPNVALSKNTVSKFWNDMGKATSRIVLFMRNRASAISLDHHILVDGTLKSNESKVNSLSDFSRKAKTKGSKDISVLYAFDLEAMEPICSKCFSGNMLDSTSYSTFISENKITKGVIVGDKGFPESAAHKHFEDNPNLHYINPIKRNSKLIDDYYMLNFTNMLAGYEGITFRKAKCTDKNKWLYSYRDSRRAAIEEQEYLNKAKFNNTYNLNTLRDKQKDFGTIVFECDLDLPAETVYKAYEKRWEIEIVMRFYKSACEFDETRVHDDYSVIGSEFCDFLSTILTFRLIKAFDNEKLLEKYTYKKLMAVLSRAKKVRVEDWQLIKLTSSAEKILQELELIPKIQQPPKKKVGRPKGSKNKSK